MGAARVCVCRILLLWSMLLTLLNSNLIVLCTSPWLECECRIVQLDGRKSVKVYIGSASYWDKNANIC